MHHDHHGLRRPAFAADPDPRCYFEGAPQRRALACLGRVLAQDDGIGVITGEAGVGKSSLAAHLAATIDPARLQVAQVSAAMPHGRRAPSEDEVRAGRPCLLIIDDAETLPTGELAGWASVADARAGGWPPRLLLIGGAGLDARLRSPQLDRLRRRLIASHRLDPLGEAEVSAYVRHRLTCAGWKGEPGLDEAILGRVARASGGVPRKINLLADRLLRSSGTLESIGNRPPERQAA